MKRSITRFAMLVIILGLGLSCGPGNGIVGPYSGSSYLFFQDPDPTDMDVVIGTSSGSIDFTNYVLSTSSTGEDVPVPNISVEAAFYAWGSAPAGTFLLEGDDESTIDGGVSINLASNYNGRVQARLWIPGSFSGSVQMVFRLPNSEASTTITVSTTPTAVACNDGLENDTDGLIDTLDPGCSGATDTTETNSAVQCDDGFDGIDTDALADMADPGCASPIDTDETSQCEDAADNADTDVLIDLADPGCSATSDNDETSQCEDGIDNEAVPDLLIDFVGLDPQCTAASDNDETL